MKHLGDIMNINGAEIPVVDCICGGSPCQDLSVAGKREGLSGERSGLFMEQIRVVKEMREHDRSFGRTDQFIRPRFMVWENVPGALSSPGKRNGEDHRGEDFQAVLTEIVKIVCPEAPDVPLPADRKWSKSGCIMGHGEDGCPFSIAWRLHDAQFWGVPQRRKRIALVADFGGASAAEVLFERKGVSGDTETCREERKGAAEDAEGCANPSSWTLKIRGGVERDSAGRKAGKGPLVQTEVATRGSDEKRTAFGVGESGDPQFTISSAHEHAVAYRKTSHAKTADDGQGWQETDVNDTLNAFDSGESRTPTVVVDRKVYDWHRCDTRMTELGDTCCTASAAWGTGGNNVPMVMENAVCIGNGQTAQTRISDKVGALNCMHDQKAVMQGISGDVAGTLDASYYKGCGERQGVEREVVAYANEAYDKWSESEKGASLRASGGVYGGGSESLAVNSVVRRLTPLECERLQGYPDNWTNIGDWIDSKGKKHKGDADSPRYKALGNSIALPFWFYLLRRISAQYERSATLGSLFDGIGGFPLCWERCNGPGTALWASEIEEFPIAVTKKHFPEKE